MGIPTLPKREVPEVGYRDIRDALINLYGDSIDPERTASEQVIEILEAYKRRQESESLSCPECGWEGTYGTSEIHHTSAGGRSWWDYLCPECRRELHKEYDDAAEWEAGRDTDDDDGRDND